MVCDGSWRPGSKAGDQLVVPSHTQDMNSLYIHATEVTSGHEAKWNLKAFNGRVIMAWLSRCSLDLLRSTPSNETLMMADTMPSPQRFDMYRICDHAPLLPSAGHLTTHDEHSHAAGHCLRCAANQMQTQIEAAGRYLFLVCIACHKLACAVSLLMAICEGSDETMLLSNFLCANSHSFM